jgi:uncharacterized protein YndB with AHSA1/START domain
MMQKLVLTTPSDREISWTRDFAAAPSRVFDALTKPELIRQWLIGPPGWTMTECQVDLRVGGKYRWAWAHPQQGALGLGGEYREIVRPGRIVSTEVYDQAWYPGEAVGTAELVDKAPGTTMRTTVLYQSKDARDAALKSNMDEGLNAGYNHLENLLSKRRWPRSVLAVIVGFAAVLVLSIGTDTLLEATKVFPSSTSAADYTDGMLGFALAYRVVYSVLGFWLTARLAPAGRWWHALGLGLFGTAVTVAGTIANLDKGHLWYPVVLSALTLPSAALGAWLATMKPRK